MNVLFSFVGARDPCWQDAQGNSHSGPLLSLLAERPFDHVYLFFNIAEDWNRRASQTLDACRRSGRCGQAAYVPLDVLDVTNHAELYRVMNDACQTILRRHRQDTPRYFVATASGTPAMQTIWVLLVQAGLIPGILLHTTHPQHARQGQPLVREIDLSLDDFPQIQSPNEAKRRLSILQAQVQALRTENAHLQALASPTLTQSQALSLEPDGVDRREVMGRIERDYYALALHKAGNNAAQAAHLLKISPHAFRKRATQLGLRPRTARTRAAPSPPVTPSSSKK